MKNLFLLFFAFSMCCIVACNSEGTTSGDASASSAAVSNLLSPKDFQTKMNEFNNEMVIDLRTHGELHQDGPITRSVNLDFNGGRFEQMIPRLNKEQPIMLYCASGGRSAKANKMLKDTGFDVYELDGGIKAWIAGGLPVQKHNHH